MAKQFHSSDKYLGIFWYCEPHIPIVVHFGIFSLQKSWCTGGSNIMTQQGVCFTKNLQNRYMKFWSQHVEQRLTLKKT